MNDLNVSKRRHKLSYTRPLLILLTLGLILFPNVAFAGSAAQPWDQWRGPSRDGSIDGADWPESLAGLDQAWRVELGEGYPGPLVVGDRVFVVEAVDNASEAVVALDRASGREIWRTSWTASGKVPFFAKRNGDWVRSTPAHDGEALYVGGMEEVMVKLDARTGGEIWRVDFPARFDTKIPDFGFASSPLIAGEALYVQAANSLVKLDRATGKTIWRALENSGEMMSSGAFSSPIMASLAGRRQLVVQTRSTLYGVDPDSGAELWSQEVPNFRGMNILTPVVHGNGVLTSTYRNRTYFYEVSTEGAALASSELWNNKVHGYMSTPVVVDGFAYLHLGNGRLACLDLKTGVERWISRPFDDYWSMVAQGDKILALDSSGTLHLLRANPDQLELLGSQEVATQPTWGHLAVSGEEIFVRELNAVAAFRWSQPKAQPEAGP